jgi:outer membrane receptor protein involved in Fe transport
LGRRVQRFARSVLPAGILLASLASGALAAAAPVYQFRISAKSVSEALIDFAVQSNLSIGGRANCAGQTMGLMGAFTVDEGLTRLLAGSNCRFRRVAFDAVRIQAILPENPRPAAPGALQQVLAAEAYTPSVLQEVVVNATKRAAAADQLPYAVSALSQQDLRVAGATDIEDIAGQLASLSTTNLGPGRDKILLRGLSDGVFTGRTQSTVGIYLDDVPITYNAPDPDLHLGDLDAIEVLRGPQGTLYGGGSMSGIYRIVTRKPELDERSGSVRAGGGLTLGGGASDQEEGTINLPLPGHRAAVRAMIYQDVDGGYISDLNLHQSNVDRSVRTGMRGSLQINLDPSWTLTTGFAFQAIRSNDTQYISPSLGRLHRANEVRESSSNDFWQGVQTVEKTTSWGDVRSTTSFVRHSFATRSDASNALPLFGANISNVGSYDEPSNIDMVVEDAVWTSPSVGRLQWLGGVFGSLTRQSTNAFVRANDPTGAPAQVLYQEFRTDMLSEAAAYGEATLSLTSTLQATVGARAFYNTVHTDSEVSDPQNNRRRLFNDSNPASGLSPKFALSYRLPRNQLLYLTVEEGHRAGGFNTGGLLNSNFNGPPGFPGVQRRFNGDALWNYEIGAKLSFLNDRLRLRSALFYNVWRDIQTDQFLISGLSFTANAGDGRNLGFETEAEMRLTRAWSAKLNVLVDQPVLTRAAPGFTAGVHLPGVPDLLAGGRTDYQFRLPWGLTGLLSADARYVGLSQLTFNPAITAPMGGYVLARLSAQVIGDRWRLAAFMSNPTNESGNTFSYGNPFNFLQVREVTPQRPRSVRLLLSVDF